ncbi:MAG: peptidoglycan-binding protein [bacterium]|jgi:nucleoid-associated protein YgaU
MALEKCYIQIEDSKSSKNGKRVTCLFNPTEYSFTRQNEWKNEPLKGRQFPKAEFTGGRATTLQVQLFFDTCEKRTDVREHTEKIWELMKIDTGTKNASTKQGRPPIVIFGWGNNVWKFKCVISSITQKFTMFLPEGTPVRATLDITFQQVEQEGLKQNPTSHAIPGATTRVVGSTDTLAQIAYEEYGDATQWRPIAEVNKLSDPLALREGDVLIIPPR